MEFLNRFSKYGPMVLRIGLAFVFLYAGIAAFLNPSSWIGFIPQWVQNMLPVEPTLFLKIHAAGDIIIGVLLFFGIFLRWAALLGALFLLLILVLYGVDEITFRDVGILGALLSLILMKKE